MRLIGQCLYQGRIGMAKTVDRDPGTKIQKAATLKS
jgi:hypothetical protein